MILTLKPRLESNRQFSNSSARPLLTVPLRARDREATCPRPQRPCVIRILVPLNAPWSLLSRQEEYCLPGVLTKVLFSYGKASWQQFVETACTPCKRNTGTKRANTRASDLSVEYKRACPSA